MFIVDLMKKSDTKFKHESPVGSAFLPYNCYASRDKHSSGLI